MNYKEILDKVVSYICLGKYQQALNDIEPVVKHLEDININNDNQDDTFYTFDDLMQEVLYVNLNDIHYEVKDAKEPYSKVYLYYGSILIRLGKYEAANEALRKSMRWNPSSVIIRTEYLETLKLLGRMDEYFKLAIDTFNYAYGVNELARCYCYLGYYFIEEMKYKEAKACFQLSLQYDSTSKNASSELYFLDQNTHRGIDNPTPEDIREYSEKYGFPIGAATPVIQIAYTIGREMLKCGNKNGAEYFYSILYELTEDADFKRILDNLRKQDLT